jgi:limonene-1,2-epoxide hydrolase
MAAGSGIHFKPAPMGTMLIKSTAATLIKEKYASCAALQIKFARLSAPSQRVLFLIADF